MRLLGSQVFKSNNCIADIHENCGLGFMCECGCHYPVAAHPAPVHKSDKE